MSMTQERVLLRVKKLLQLKRSDNEHEAAQAAAKAAALIEEFQLSEALLRLDDDTTKAEAIVENATVEGEAQAPSKGKRVAWKGTIAGSLARSLGCEMFWWHNGQIRCYGRESAVQTWSYTCRVLFNEVDRLCHAAWEREGEEAELAGQSARKWKNAFRIGAAVTVAGRLSEERKAKATARATAKAAAAEGELRTAVKNGMALMLVEQDEAEVKTEYAKFEKREKMVATAAIGRVSSRSGLDAGREAGARININRNRAGLAQGQRRIGKE